MHAQLLEGGESNELDPSNVRPCANYSRKSVFFPQKVSPNNEWVGSIKYRWIIQLTPLEFCFLLEYMFVYLFSPPLLRMEPKALSLPGKCSTTELNLQTWNMRF